MKTIQLPFLLLFGLLSSCIFAQTATLRGIIFDEQDNVVPGATVSYDDKGTLSDDNGVYVLEIPANREVVVTFSYLGLKDVVLKVTLGPNEDYEVNPQMKTDIETIGVVIDVKGENVLRAYKRSLLN